MTKQKNRQKTIFNMNVITKFCNGVQQLLFSYLQKWRKPTNDSEFQRYCTRVLQGNAYEVILKGI